MILKNLLITQKPQVRTPLWIMRQAGRYLPEYKAVRKNFKDFIEFCLTPEAASEVTLQPLKRFDLDAAIIFSDILIVPYALGVDVKFVEGEGPLLSSFNKLEFKPDAFDKVAQSIRLTKAKLDKTLIGFAGSPWTVVSYMLRGKGGYDFSLVIKECYQNPMRVKKLIDEVVVATIEYLSVQIEAGADVIKLFDSWAGIIPHNLFDEYCIQPSKKIVEALRAKYKNVPIIFFPKGANALLTDIEHLIKPDAIAIDQFVEFNKARVSVKVALQGNFDNMLLAYGDSKAIEAEAKSLMSAAKGTPYIFNLGHGILPETPISNVELLVEMVRRYEGR